ncbi:MAG: M3 family metallopeptidase, partial [Clostridiales bacterium]
VVLTNFIGDTHSLFTLAHELGHCMHSYYSDATQNYNQAGYTIFVAEVASTVNETILIDYLLKNAQNKDEKLYILNNYLEEFRGTVFRQTMFAEFEKATHWEVESGRTLTAEKLNKMYYGLNSEYFGKIINADDNIALEWSRIPHFYRAFYVYKYATGFSAAQALAQGLLDPDPLKAKKAREGYIRFLSAGDSLEPIAALKEAGVDMTTTEPVEAAMKIFGQRLAEIKALL